VRKRYLTGSPVIVRPMTSRWISDVPSKMVKFSGVRFGHLGRLVEQGSELGSYISSASVVVRRFQSASGAETEQRERSVAAVAVGLGRVSGVCEWDRL
jgi:hypothetical protein